MSLDKKVRSFLTGQSTSGQNGLSLVTECIDHMFKHSDWTPLAMLIGKSDTRNAPVFRAITNKVCGGISLQRDKKQPSGLRFTLGENAGPTEEMTTLREMVSDRESFRGAVVQKWLRPEKTDKPVDVSKWAKQILTRLNKNNIQIKELMQAIGEEQQKLVIDEK